MTIHILASLVLGLICGSELNVAAFAHPTLNRQTMQVHVPMRSSLAVVFGRVMPFWMGGSAMLNLLVLLPFEHLNGSAWHLAAAAFAIQALAIPFLSRLRYPSTTESQGGPRRRFLRTGGRWSIVGMCITGYEPVDS